MNTDTPRTDRAWKFWIENGLASNLANECAQLERELNAANAEIERWKKDIIPFLAVHAAIYGRDHYGDMCMHYTHYDLLKEAGGRMDDFIRCGEKPNADF